MLRVFLFSVFRNRTKQKIAPNYDWDQSSQIVSTSAPFRRSLVLDDFWVLSELRLARQLLGNTFAVPDQMENAGKGSNGQPNI